MIGGGRVNITPRQTVNEYCLLLLPTEPQPAFLSGGLRNVWSTGMESHIAEHPTRGCTFTWRGVGEGHDQGSSGCVVYCSTRR